MKFIPNIFVSISLIITSSVIILYSGPVFSEQTCKFATPAWKKMEIKRISIEKGNGEVVKLRSRIADETDERSAGYQYICPEIIKISSILFVYSQPVDFQYHMFNVYDSLDIGFFSEIGDLISVQRMEPQVESDPNAKYYSSSKPYQYALEVRPGFFEEHGIEAGNAKLAPM